jgi:ATP-dependent helicase/nuclease subunit B
VYLEVAVGLPKYSEKSPLDLEHSVKVMLPGFGQLAIHGKIDRIEALDTEGNFKIMDYKSGSRKSIEADRDAGQARLAQPFVYAELAVEALKQKHSGARVVSFEYFFPSPKERGGKLSLDANEISRAKTQLSALCELARQGRFPTTNDKEDCRYCEFARVCGSAEQVAKRCAGKLENFEDEQLELYRELRLKRG